MSGSISECLQDFKSAAEKSGYHQLLSLQFVPRGGYIMKITDIRVRKVAKQGKMRAVVSVTFDNEFVVHDIKVIEGDRGLFIAMPSKKSADGEYRDIAHPINSDMRGLLQTQILEAYDKASLEEGDEASEAPAEA